MFSRGLILASLVAVCACGAGSGRGGESHPQDPPETLTGPSERPTRTTGRVGVEITTVGEVAEALGVHVDYLFLANNACAVNIPCRVERGERVTTVDQCEEHLTREWCPGDVCRESYLDPPSTDDDPCIDDVRSRTCSEMDRPIECDGLRRAGLELRPTDWPR